MDDQLSLVKRKIVNQPKRQGLLQLEREAFNYENGTSGQEQGQKRELKR